MGRSLTQCRRHACLTSAAASASACVRACLRAGAGRPRSAAATTTRRAAGESPIATKQVAVCCAPGFRLSRALRACVRCRWCVFSLCGCAFGGVGGRPWAAALKMLPVPTIRSWVAEGHGRRIVSAATWRQGAGARCWGAPSTPPRACESAGCFVALRTALDCSRRSLMLRRVAHALSQGSHGCRHHAGLMACVGVRVYLRACMPACASAVTPR